MKLSCRYLIKQHTSSQFVINFGVKRGSSNERPEDKRGQGSLTQGIIFLRKVPCPSLGLFSSY